MENYYHYWNQVLKELLTEININQNQKYRNKNQYLDYLTDPGFQRVNRLSILSYKNNAHYSSYMPYFLPAVERKDYDVMIDGKNVFDQPLKNDPQKT